LINNLEFLVHQDLAILMISGLETKQTHINQQPQPQAANASQTFFPPALAVPSCTTSSWKHMG